jgi:hypothetical protein
LLVTAGEQRKDHEAPFPEGRPSSLAPPPGRHVTRLFRWSGRTHRPSSQPCCKRKRGSARLRPPQ